METKIISRMNILYDKYGNRLSIHTRIKNGIIEVIVNRSCDECKYFTKGVVDICKECHYQKGWLEKGKY